MSGAHESRVPLLGWIAGAFTLGAAAWSVRPHTGLWADGARGWTAGELAAVAIVACLGAGAWRRRRFAALCLLLAGCALLGAARVAQSDARWARMLERWGLTEATERRLVRVRGVVVTIPRADERAWREVLERCDALCEDVLTKFSVSEPRIRFDIDPITIEPAPSNALAPHADLRVLVDGLASGCLPGDTIDVIGWLTPLDTSRNPGGFDTQAWGRSRSIAATLCVASSELVTRVDDAPVSVRALVARWRSWVDVVLRESIGEDAPPDASALVASSTTGGVWPGLSAASLPFRRTGTQHLVAISGFNFGILAGAALWLTSLIRASTVASGIVLLLLAILFAATVESEVSSTRAALMGAISAAALSFSRSLVPTVALSLAALVISWSDPRAPSEPGFQLSFAAVIGLRVGAGPLARVFASRVGGVGVASALVRRLCVPVGASLSAWTATLPIVLCHFGACAWLCIPVTLTLTLPFALMVVSSNAAIALSSLSPILGTTMGCVAIHSSQAVLAIARSVDTLPGAMPVSRTVPVVDQMGDAELRLDMLDVGDGSCHLIRTSTHSVLFDCGSLDSTHAGSRVVVPALMALGVTRLDAVVISHPHFDHFNALPEVATAFRVPRVIVTGDFLASTRRAKSAPAVALDFVRLQGTRVDTAEAGGVIMFGDARWQILRPPAGVGFTDANEGSLVARIEHGNRSILLLGDIGRESCVSLLTSGDPKSLAGIDVMELPHHGSFLPQSAALVERVKSCVLLQSTGPRRLLKDRWIGHLGDATRLVTSRHRACAVEWHPNGSMRVGVWTGEHYEWRAVRSALAVGRDEESTLEKHSVAHRPAGPFLEIKLQKARVDRHSECPVWHFPREWHPRQFGVALANDERAVGPRRHRSGNRHIGAEDGEPLGDFVDLPLRPPD